MVKSRRNTRRGSRKANRSTRRTNRSRRNNMMGGFQEMATMPMADTYKSPFITNMVRY